MVRPEATGFGGLYFVSEMLQDAGESIEGKTVAISGFGNVAWGAATKATQLGAKVVTLSGPDGYVYDPEVGDPDGGIAPGTKFEDIPDDWVCPLCGATKDMFQKA